MEGPQRFELMGQTPQKEKKKKTAHSQNKSNPGCIKWRWFQRRRVLTLPNSTKLLVASSHMTALEDAAFHRSLITMLKLQPASQHTPPDRLPGINGSPLISLAYYWLSVKEPG